MASNIKQNTKYRVLMRDGFCCVYCNKEITEVRDLTFDHVLPMMHGGKSGVSNTAVCCFECNQTKGSLLLTQFIRALELKITKRLDRFL